MPRIPSTAFCPRPAGSWRWNSRRTSASIPASQAGGEVTPFYDAMIAKLIAHAPTREAALDKLAAALDQHADRRPAQQSGVSRQNSAGAGEFRQGKVDTGFIERNLAALGAEPQPPDKAAAALGVAHLLAAQDEAQDQASLAEDAPPDSPSFVSPWAVRDGFQLGGARIVTLPIVVDGESETATVTIRQLGHFGRGRRRAGGRRRQGVRSGRRCLCVAGRPPDPRASEGLFRSHGRRGDRRRRRSRRRCTARCWKSSPSLGIA